MKKLSLTFRKYVQTTEHQGENRTYYKKVENLPTNANINFNELS